jgi:hypothetical protein
MQAEADVRKPIADCDASGVAGDVMLDPVRVSIVERPANTIEVLIALFIAGATVVAGAARSGRSWDSLAREPA